MNVVSVDLSLKQIKQALRRLPSQKKVALWRMLDKDLDRHAIARGFAASVQSIRKAYANIEEDEVMNDAVTRQVRKARHTKSRS